MPATKPEIDALHAPTKCACGRVFTPKRVTISAALKRGTAPRFYCSTACVATASEAKERRRKTVGRMIEAGRWAGPNSLRDHEIERVVREGLPCAQCGTVFQPKRDAAHRFVRGKQQTFLCSLECAGDYRSATTAGVSRPIDGGFGKSEHNQNAHFYCVKSPDNVHYVFRNANHFVREHPHLFTEEQRREGGPTIMAASGLRSLFLEKMDYRTGKLQQREQWRGWTGVWKKDRLGNVVWSRYPIR